MVRDKNAYIILALFGMRLHGADLQVVFVVNELAFVAIGALPRCLLVPLFTHFSLIVLVELLWSRLHYQFRVTVGVGALLIELAKSSFHEIPAQLCFVIEFEILNIAQHLFARLEMHLFLLSWLLAREAKRSVQLVVRILALCYGSFELILASLFVKFAPYGISQWSMVGAKS